MTRNRWVVAAVVAWTAAGLAWGDPGEACRPVWDQRFPGIGLTGAIGAVEADFGDGPTFLAYGTFTLPVTEAESGLSRLTPDGWRAIAFPDDNLRPVEIQAALVRASETGGDEVWIGGEFLDEWGTRIGGVARFDGQGVTLVGGAMMTAPTESHPGGSPAEVDSLSELTLNGVRSVYATGRLEQADGVVLTGVARWTGTAWEPVGWTGPGPTVGLSGASSLAVASTPDGERLFAFGGLSFGRAALGGVAYFDGQRWQALFDCSRPNCVLQTSTWGAVLETADGPRLAVGAGTESLVWDGTRWAALEASGFTGFRDVTSTTHGTFALAGTSGASELRLTQVVRWDGTGWTTLGSLPLGSSNWIGDLSVSREGRLLITSARWYVPQQRIMSWDGAAWRDQETDATPDGPSDFVHTALSLIENGQTVTYISGPFTRVNDLTAPGIARWDGSSWTSPGSMTYRRYGSGQYGSTVYGPALTLHDSGNGPRLHALTGRGAQEFDGTRWSSLGGLSSPVFLNSQVMGLASALDAGVRKLFVGSYFMQFRDPSSPSQFIIAQIATWDGSQWSVLPEFPQAIGDGFGPGTGMSLASVDTGDGPRLHVGVLYGSSDPSLRIWQCRVARLDSGLWTMIDDGVTAMDRPRGAMRAMGFVDQGPARGLYLGFQTTSVATSEVGSAIRRWHNNQWTNAVGTDGSSLRGDAHSFQAAWVNGRRVLLVGGRYTSILRPGLPPEPCLIAQWDGERWSVFSTGVPGNVSDGLRSLLTTSVRGQPLLIAAGSFSSLNGVRSWNFAQAELCAPECRADLNFDGRTDAVDLVSMLNQFGTRTIDPLFAPDINDDGVVDNADLSILLGEFARGCG